MFFESEGVRLYFEKAGQGRPLILLHGNGEDHTIFDEAAALLREQFTVYAIDSRGHGQSSAAEELHYTEMAEDVYRFICDNNIEKPIIYGFSDGGILALLLAAKYPELPERAIVSGVNVQPKGIKPFWLVLFRLIHFFTKSPAYALMLNEPNISDEMLGRITIPVEVLGGSRDMISRSHMKAIAEAIPLGNFTELHGEDHGSYVVHSEKIAKIILEKGK